MADQSKAEKLAAARQMLKKYQQKNKESNLNGSQSVQARNIVHNSTTNGKETEVNPVTSQVVDFSNGTPAPFEKTDIQDNLRHDNSLGQSVVSSFFSSNEDVNRPSPNFFDSIEDQSAEKYIRDVTAPDKLDVNKTVPSNFTYNEESVVRHQFMNTASQYTNMELEDVPKQMYYEELPLAANNLGLDSELRLEQEKNTQLKSQLNESKELIASLETKLKNTLSDYESRINRDISSYEEKLKMQSRAIEILVSEKSELQNQIENLQQGIKSKSDECLEAQGRLGVWQSEAGRLRRDLKISEDARAGEEQAKIALEMRLAQAQKDASALRNDFEESDAERRELKRRLESVTSESANLRKQFEETGSQLAMARLRLQQLGNGENKATEEVKGDSAELKEEVAQLEAKLAEAVREKEEAALNYQEYINRINAQHLAKEHAWSSEKEALEGRIQGLISSIAELERELQRRQEAVPIRREEDEEEIHKLKTNVVELENRLKAKDEELEKIEAIRLTEVKELEMRLEQARMEVPDARLLHAAMESDKLAATRAIEQNNALKQQLGDMQEAFTRLSDSKLELMEALEEEQQLCSKLRQQIASHQCAIPAKEESKESIDGCSQTTYHDFQEAMPDKENEPAMSLLEGKLRKTMEQVAELNEEKQRLEHLVMQLQGETETIGEYIALYQAQRSLLVRKAEETEEHVNAVCRERETLRTKLAQAAATLAQLNLSGDEETGKKMMALVEELNAADQTSPIIFHSCPLCKGRPITL